MRNPTAPKSRSTSARCRGLALLALALPLGCRTPGPEEPQPSEEKPSGELTVQKFQELISQGALKPVKAMEDDPYDKAKPDMDEDVFAKAVEQLEHGGAPTHEAQQPAETPTEFPEN